MSNLSPVPKICSDILLDMTCIEMLRKCWQRREVRNMKGNSAEGCLLDWNFQVVL